MTFPLALVVNGFPVFARYTDTCKWMNEIFTLKQGKNISITIENEEIQLKYNFLFTGLHICRVGVRYREPFINFSLEVA